ncbi:transposase [Streptomyces spiralis]|uniref:transposase n=1 Tax=Streptomyces spiralis TaxID=66376 RepID=UPI0035710371
MSKLEGDQHDDRTRQSAPGRPRGGEPRVGESRSAARDGQDVRRRTHVWGGRCPLQREHGRVSDERVNQSNGYRPRERDTRAGTAELAIPKHRSGSCFRTPCCTTAITAPWPDRTRCMPTRRCFPCTCITFTTARASAAGATAAINAGVAVEVSCRRGTDW